MRPTRHLDRRPAASVASQFAGAIVAAWVLQVMFGNVAAGGNYPMNRAGGEWRSFVMEIILTAILVTVILNTATGYRSIRHNAALAVGATVALLGVFASPISGASMNPARTLGPDIVANKFTGWWVYVVGDVAGAAIAVMITGLLRGIPARRSAKRLKAARWRSLPQATSRARRDLGGWSIMFSGSAINRTSAPNA